MLNHYFSQKKMVHISEPTNSLMKQGSLSQSVNISDQIDFLEQKLNQIEMNHQNNMIQINYIMERANESLANSENVNQKIIEKRIDNEEYKFAIMLEENKADIEQKGLALKAFVRDNGRIMSEIISSEIKEEIACRKEIDSLVNKKMSQIQKAFNVLTSKDAKSKKKSITQPAKWFNLSEKLNEKMKILDKELLSLKEQNKMINKEGIRLMQQYVKILDDIEEERKDRQAKQQIILAKIDELSSGDRTKEETISRIQ